MELPSEILSLSPEEAARRIALGYLEEARAAAARLDDEAHREGLHDFRVAVRRLRSTLRAWRPVLAKSVRKPQRRALRAIQSATGAGRDAEVALLWLAEQRSGLRPNQRFGHDWLVARLEERRQRALGQARSEVREAFDQLRIPLQERLELLTLRVHLVRARAGTPFAAALAAKAREAGHRLASLLRRLESSEDQPHAHQARIACKRLRYLVEPVASRAEGGNDVVQRCKRLQDALGQLNDAYVLREELGTALEAAAAEQARRLHELARGENSERLRRETRRTQRAGLLELTRRVQQHILELHRRLHAEWVGGGIVELVEALEALAAHLEGCARHSLEIERKYLLLRMPDLGERADITLEIDQGWLPGQRLRERLRRERGPDGSRYVRTLKLGHGVQRTEIEEPTTREMFERLWPLTEGCRVRKRRHRVREGERVWEIDEFLDRELILAEVELDDAAERPKIPEWLAPHVVREVTDDPRYTNLNLAR